jgi:ABC-2 type transport system ATP-binding protein
MSTPAITTQGLTKTYASAFGRKKIEALRGIDIEVAQGEIVGILGPNGAGKTTLLKILLGIVSPTSGSATLMGRPIGEVEARRKLGYLPENHRFPPYLTARQTLGIYGRLSHLSADYRAKHIPLLVEQAGLASWIDVRVGKFSKGMMQRLGLAQALLNDPDILILDEPTDGVDPVGRREIRDRLRNLKARGKTILINSHLLTEIELICDRVAIMNFGQIVRSGSVSEISTEGTGWRIQCRNLPIALDLSSYNAKREDLNTGPIPEKEVDTGWVSQDEVNLDPSVEKVIILDSGLTETLNALIDYLRSNGVNILSVERHRRSLEAGFLDIIDQQKAKS